MNSAAASVTATTALAVTPAQYRDRPDNKEGAAEVVWPGQGR